MGLPFKPQSLSELRHRFPAAINHYHQVRPGKHRAHVFDTEDGLRLIVSVESINGDDVLHVSGSVESNSAVGQKVRKGFISEADLIGWIECRFAALWGDDPPTLVFVGASSGVAHWTVGVVVLEEDKR